MFGLPRLAPAPNGFCGADVDDGSGTGSPDAGVDINDLTYFLAAFEPGDLAADLDDGSGLGIPDNGVDINDLMYFLAAFEEGARGGDLTDLRFAWRGYLWDKHLQLYHVRHRAFDPKLMVWLQPDPLGDVDGPNPYAYVGWDPFNKLDPYGLQARTPDGFALDPSAPVPIELITSLEDFRRLEDHARSSTDHSYTVRLRNNVDVIYTWNGTGWDAKKTTHDGQVIDAIQAAREGGAQVAARDAAAIGATLETVLCVASEPVDWVMTAGAIAENPSDWTNYAGFLPFVPGVIRKADDVLDATGAASRAKGIAAEKRVEECIGVPRNTGPGRETVPGSGPGGIRVPDFPPGLTISTVGGIVEVKDLKGVLRSTRQIEDLVGYAESQGTRLIIYTNAKLPQSGNIPRWRTRGLLEIRPLP